MTKSNIREIVKTDVDCELVFMTANSIFHKFSQCTKLVFMTTNSIFTNLVNVPETTSEELILICGSKAEMSLLMVRD